MNDKTPMQANGQNSDDDKDGGAKPGTVGAGESGGGAYPNPHDGKAPQDGFMGHGGQTEITEKPAGQKPG